MKKTLKKILIKLNLWEVQDEKVQTPIRFPGGLTPIHETNPEDVFIVGFPKSGNTLMQHIITHLVYGINEEGSRSMVNLIVPDIYANSHYFRFNTVCYFKSHERPQPNYKRVIYLVRDGREALLSYYHMMKNMGKDISLTDQLPGKYTATLTLPNNFFNKGNYKIVINCGIPNLKILFPPKTVMEFNIEKLTSSGSKVTEVFPGVTAPLLNWKIIKL